MGANSVRSKTKHIGVYQRSSEKRINFRDGKADVCFDITYKDANGRKIWEKAGWRSEGYTAQMASLIRMERIQAIRHGDVIPQKKRDVLTIGQAWDIFEKKWLPNFKRPKSTKQYYNRYIAPKFGDTPLNQISLLDLENFKQELLQRLAPGSVVFIFAALRLLYNKMVEWGLYNEKVPTANLKMPKLDNARVRYLSPEEAKALLSTLKTRSHLWWALASVSLHTGMRFGEIVSLRSTDINLETGIIHVRDAKAGSRMAYMPSELKPLFEKVMQNTPVLFQTAKGKPVNSTANSIFAKAVKDLGLNHSGETVINGNGEEEAVEISDRRQRVVFHTLRHTFASWLAIRGVPLYTISKLMGHRTLEMTQRYAHLCPDSQREAIGNISKILHN